MTKKVERLKSSGGSNLHHGHPYDPMEKKVAPPKDENPTKEIIVDVTNKGKDVGTSNQVSIPSLKRIKDEKKDKDFSRFLEVFRKLHIHIPIIKVITHMPYDAKFLKIEILEEYEVVNLTKECYIIVLKKFPLNLRIKGNSHFEKALCDLGASINLMLYFLANKTISHPLNIAEDILVKVREFIFLIDFVIIDMEEKDEVPIILGQPFLATRKVIIDVESSSDPLYDLDLEIEITLCRLRKVRNIVVSSSINSSSVSISDNGNFVTNNSDSFEYSIANNFAEPEQMENNDRTLKELATPDVVYQPLCIQYPQLEPTQTYELKSSLIHLRRPPQALKGISCDLFHNEVARDTEGLYQNEGVCIFLGWGCEGLAISTAGSLQHLGRHETHVFGEVLSSIKNRDYQKKNLWDKETLWRNTLEKHSMNNGKDSTSYVPHYFYEGLMMMDRSMIDAANGGALMDKMLAAARHLISNMANNTQ
ncbi:hypothetical protein CR513_38439, partial [Mucuna pruriens]